MGKKLKLYERFLLALACCTDELIDCYQASCASRSRIKKHFYRSWLPLEADYEPSKLRYTYYRLLKTGYIEKVIKNGKPYLRLTNKAGSKLKRDFPLLTIQRKKWDKKWRLVIFDIKEKEKSLRERLRDKLKELGFGMLQKSIYISPHDLAFDVYEFLKNNQLLGKAFILTAKHELMGEAEKLAEVVWQTKKLEEEYKNLWFDILEAKRKGITPKKKQEIKNRYLELMQKDPCLPFELLPPDWPEPKVRKASLSL
jgi:phenylacetic acid degradation operon negative regulatory protein